jgi:hypothetical protein
MYRIINGSLHMDWPWDRKRFDQDFKWERIRLINFVLSRVKDIKDSVFLMAQELPVFPYNYPFPIFTSSTTFQHADIPFPWDKSFQIELFTYKEAFEYGRNLTQEIFERHHSVSADAWGTRVSKAAFYGSITTVRQIVFDMAALRPDLIDAGWTNDMKIGTGPPPVHRYLASVSYCAHGYVAHLVVSYTLRHLHHV